MTSPIEPRTASLYHASQAPTVDPIIAAAAVGLAMATYLLAAALAPASLALVAAQIGLAGGALATVLIVHPQRPLAALGLRGARPRFLLAGLAIGATTWYLNALLVDLVFRAFDLPTDGVKDLKGLVDRPPLWQSLAMFAVMPAVCEEIVFRGVLARSLGRWAKLVPAAVMSAMAFSAYHLSLIQALPTFTLGIVLGMLAIRADSIAPTVLAHAINNALAIAMSREELPEIAAWLGRYPLASALGCSAATAWGIAVSARRPT